MLWIGRNHSVNPGGLTAPLKPVTAPHTAKKSMSKRARDYLGLMSGNNFAYYSTAIIFEIGIGIRNIFRSYKGYAILNVLQNNIKAAQSSLDKLLESARTTRDPEKLTQITQAIAATEEQILALQETMRMYTMAIHENIRRNVYRRLRQRRKRYLEYKLAKLDTEERKTERTREFAEFDRLRPRTNNSDENTSWIQKKLRALQSWLFPAARIKAYKKARKKALKSYRAVLHMKDLQARIALLDDEINNPYLAGGILPVTKQPSDEDAIHTRQILENLEAQIKRRRTGDLYAKHQQTNVKHDSSTLDSSKLNGIFGKAKLKSAAKLFVISLVLIPNLIIFSIANLVSANVRPFRRSNHGLRMLSKRQRRVNLRLMLYRDKLHSQRIIDPGKSTAALEATIEKYEILSIILESLRKQYTSDLYHRYASWWLRPTTLVARALGSQPPSLYNRAYNPAYADIIKNRVWFDKPRVRELLFASVKQELIARGYRPDLIIQVSSEFARILKINARTMGDFPELLHLLAPPPRRFPGPSVRYTPRVQPPEEPTAVEVEEQHARTRTLSAEQEEQLARAELAFAEMYPQEELPHASSENDSTTPEPLTYGLNRGDSFSSATDFTPQAPPTRKVKTSKGAPTPEEPQGHQQLIPTHSLSKLV